MRSRDNAFRRGAEWSLRALSFGLLAWMIWTAFAPPRPRGPETAHGTELEAALRGWTVSPPSRAHLELHMVPTAPLRDWARALRRAGTPVGWSSHGIPPMAMEVVPSSDPRGSVRVLLTAPEGSRSRVEDAIGVLDSAVIAGRGVTFPVDGAIGVVQAKIGEHSASDSPRDSVHIKPILVLARATWEAKFVIAALEERGWRVQARLTVAPGLEVRQGAPSAPDTARYSAVIALDSSAAPLGGAIARYVRSGGGAILGPEAARIPALARLAPGKQGSRIRPATLTFAVSEPRQALWFSSIVSLHSDAIPLESRNGRVAVAARRIVAGRVIQLGYDETWRWRLAGGENAPTAHRDWWSAVVASAAYRAAEPRTLSGPVAPAPLAHLVDALGPSSAPSKVSDKRSGSGGVKGWMLVLLLAALLAEWGSRRFRGAP